MSGTVSFMATTFRPPDEVGEVLLEDVSVVLTGVSGPEDRGAATRDFSVPIGGQGHVSWPARVRIAATEMAPRAWKFAVDITPVGSRNRFPTFAGTLEVTDGGFGDSVLALRGDYRLPLGLLGGVSAILSGNDLAEASLEEFFEALIGGVRRELLARTATRLR